MAFKQDLLFVFLFVVVSEARTCQTSSVETVNKSALDNIELDLDISYKNNSYVSAKLVVKGAYTKQGKEENGTVPKEDNEEVRVEYEGEEESGVEQVIVPKEDNEVVHVENGAEEKSGVQNGTAPKMVYEEAGVDSFTDEVGEVLPGG